MFSNIFIWFIRMWNEIGAFILHYPVQAAISVVLGMGVGISVVGIFKLVTRRKS